MKKKLIALVTALTLCAAVAVGATLAYFANTTEAVENVFRYNNDGGGKGTIEEPKWPNDTFSPGQTVPKDPYLDLSDGDVQEDKNGDDLYEEYFVALEITGGPQTKDNPPVDPADNVLQNLKAILKDKKAASIVGWSDQFDYAVNETNGNIYALYKGTLTDPADTNKPSRTPSVFTGVKMAGPDVLDALLIPDPANAPDGKLFPNFHITVQGYIIEALNDTQYSSTFDPNDSKWEGKQVDRTDMYDQHASCLKAMQLGWPTIFGDENTTVLKTFTTLAEFQAYLAA